LALPLFAITLFVSAFILFLVQPMIGKMILPRLGGTPQVWNTCMVFFQAALLAGYGYTHTVSTRLPLRRQLMLHALFLIIPFAVLLPIPFNISGFQPPPGGNPIFYTLFYLSMVVGLPFIVVATSAPLLQKWFAATGHPASKDPYFLYGASNLGSMLALLAYPFVVEPNMLLGNQAWLWMGGYALLLVLVLMCVALVFQSPHAKVAVAGGHGTAGSDSGAPEAGSTGGTATANPAPSAPAETGIKKPPKQFPKPMPGRKETEPVTIPHATDEITGWRRLRWVGLGAVPTSLMLGVTTHITTDLSPIPLIWLVPLTLYLLTFIIVFSRWPVVWTEKPHTVMLYLQPVALALMIFIDIYGTPQHYLRLLVFFLVLGFFWTAMVCHGELARDRPGTKHLTEFYLWMSVGGVVGGIFNGLIAPIVFYGGTWEFPLAIMAACFLRPKMRDSGWTDDVVANFMDQPAAPDQARKGHKHHQRPVVKVERSPSFHLTIDVVLPAALLVYLVLAAFVLTETIQRMAGETGMMYFLIFGIPLMICCFYFGRPIRFGLAIGAVLLVHLMYTGQGRGTIFAARSYFGLIRVIESARRMPSGSEGGVKVHTFTQLLHGTTDHGMNFEKPTDKNLRGNSLEDYSRLATTYYHQLGPVGRAMEKFNWFKDKNNHYHSDARMVISQLGMCAAPLGTTVPVNNLVDLWSEPPYATIGLGTGTMASYSRLYQHVHFYEIDNVIRRLSLPRKGGRAYFTYLQGALDRGSCLQVYMGDARLRMAMDYEPLPQPPEEVYTPNKDGGGPESFYHLMVVDAFSSDAIPVHLITKQAIEMYFKKLTLDGVLCVHTSNRHLDLVKVVADVTNSIKWTDADGVEKTLVCKRGHDVAPGDEELVKRRGHYTSEWVMVAREMKYLDHLTPPEGYEQKLRQYAEEQAKLRNARIDVEDYWTIPQGSVTGRRYVWTDDYSNLIAVLR
jgi:hypothetical protein